jgi:peptidoglycan/LPS O-acetylase OafA/YrhL
MTSTRVEVRSPRTAVRHNNFDGLRLLGALLVVVGHGYVLTGRHDVPVVLGEQIHHFGVIIFFSLSGYLVTSSWLRFRRVTPYLGARLLRILPGLVVVVGLTTFVLGPLVTTLPLTDYLTSRLTWTYLANAFLHARFELPGVFADLPYPRAVNGSLWTLAPEFFCYLLVPVLVWRHRTRVAIVLMLGMAAVWLALPRTPVAPIYLWGANLGDTAVVARYFFVGGALAVLATVRPAAQFLSVRLALAAIVGVALVEHYLPSVQGPVALLLLPYAIVSFGVAATPWVSSAARWGDLSYGMYVWAYPVQQTLVLVAGVLPLWIDIPVVALVSGALAWVSWHVVEAPALRLKSRLRRPTDPAPSSLPPDERQLDGIRQGEQGRSVDEELGAADPGPDDDLAGRRDG